MNKKIWVKVSYILASLLVFGVFLYLIQIPSAKDFLTKIENTTFDLRQNIVSKHKKTSDKIVIIDVNDASYEYIVDKYGSWPAPRAFWADLITNLEPVHPDMIIFDMLFLKKHKADGASDFELIKAVNTNKNVYISMNLDNYPPEVRIPPQLPDALKNAVENDFLIKQNPDLSVEDFIDMDPTKISWTVNLKKDIERNIPHIIQEDIRYSTYRPFSKQWLYYDRPFIERIGLSPKLFPTTQHQNLVICVSGVGASKDFSTLITDCIPDLQLQFNGQCFPLYWYDDRTADITDLFSSPQNEADRYVRRDGVTDWILSTARKQYGSKVGKEDIFYYVYGILHSPEYRTAFASDLKKSLPRLPLVDSADDFWAFSKAGRDLAELHLNYETVEPYKGCLLVYGANTNRGDSINYRVEKMRFGKLDSKTPDKTKIYYNQYISIENIPLEAYDYVVNGKSAIEWIMERYAVTVHKDSGIRNDPNDWAAEHNDEKYILNLLLRIITVSLETMKIVNALPKLKFEE